MQATAGLYVFKKIKNFLLSQREVIEDERMLRVFGKRLRDPRLWSLNRNGIATGVAVGLFCAYLPMPAQFLPATIGAIAVRGNLPIAVALLWISNPVTWIPFYTPAYKLGTRILGIHSEQQTLAMAYARSSNFWRRSGLDAWYAARFLEPLAIFSSCIRGAFTSSPDGSNAGRFADVLGYTKARRTRQVARIAARRLSDSAHACDTRSAVLNV